MIGLNNFQIWRLIFVFDPVINIDSLPKVLAASACIRSCLVALTYAASLISIDAVSVSASGICDDGCFRSMEAKPCCDRWRKSLDTKGRRSRGGNAEIRRRQRGRSPTA